MWGAAGVLGKLNGPDAILLPRNMLVDEAAVSLEGMEGEPSEGPNNNTNKNPRVWHQPEPALIPGLGEFM